MTKQEKSHLEKLRRSDLDSFKWVYQSYHGKVYFFCYKLCGDQQVAEEITEDVFVKLWSKRAMLDPAKGVSGLLIKMTKDYVWSYLKHSSRIRKLQDQYFLENLPKAPPDIESDLILQDYLTIAEEGINLLPEKCRYTFNLRYKKGLNNQEIARKMGISEVTVRVQLSKAVKFLRNYLQSHPEIPLHTLIIFHLLQEV